MICCSVFVVLGLKEAQKKFDKVTQLLFFLHLGENPLQPMIKTFCDVSASVI